MERIKIGIIGSGGRIRGVTKGTLEAGKGRLEVKSFYDISEQSVRDTEASFPGIHRADTLETLLSDRDISWVFIGSFNAVHKEHLLAAMEAGKNIFIEKPLATTVEDIRAIERAAGGFDKRIVVGFVLRYSPFYRKLKELLDEGAIGKMISFEFNETLDPRHGAAMHGNWRRRREFAGPFLLEKCCHDMDIMHWLTDSKPKRVASFGGCNFFTPVNKPYEEKYPNDRVGFSFYHSYHDGAFVGKENNITPFNDDKDVIDNQVAIMELENGVRASFHLNAHAAIKERRFYICGTEGVLRGDMTTGLVEHRKVGWDEPVQLYEPTRGQSHGGGDPVLAADLAAAILENKALPTGLKEGIESSLSCLAVDRAMIEGRIVER